MNANELANWIEKGAPYREYETAKQTVIMLRQLQAENEALKAKTLTDEEITIVKEAVGDYVCTIKMEIDQEKQKFKGYENCSNLTALRSELKDAEQALAIIRKDKEK